VLHEALLPHLPYPEGVVVVTAHAADIIRVLAESHGAHTSFQEPSPYPDMRRNLIPELRWQ